MNDNTFKITEEDLNRILDISTDPIRVEVIATIRKREAGEYTCTVRTDISVSPSPFQTTATTPGMNISGKILISLCYIIMLSLQSLVTSTPTNLLYTRIDLTLVLLTWSPPMNNIPAVIGYEVFLDISNGTRVSMETNITELNITSLQPDTNYTASVVAYGGDLPSERINTAISQGNLTCYFHSHWSLNGSLNSCSY